MSCEPILTSADRSTWEQWERLALAHAGLAVHKARVQRSLGIVADMAKRCPSAYIAWSGGKDSTALVHLVCVEAGLPVRAMSIKDDLDFPGEEEYVLDLSAEWGVACDIVRPPFSLQDWLKQHGAELDPGEDMHGRDVAFAKKAFYLVVEAYRLSHASPGVYLGLRKEESRARMMNRIQRGPIYTKKTGETVCQPLCDWTGSKGIDLDSR